MSANGPLSRLPPYVNLQRLQPAVWIALVALLALLPTRSVLAQDELATVRVDGRPVFQVGPGAADETAQQRARRVEERIAALLRDPDVLGPVLARQTASGWTVSASGVPVVNVTARDAESNFTTPEALAAQWANALREPLDRARERRLSTAGRWLAETRASGEAALGRLSESAARTIPRALAAVFVVLLFWIAARLIRAGLRLLIRRVIEDVTIESLLKQLAYYFVLTLGFFVAVDALGFDPKTVAAGLGLTGIVLGFALKDVLSNFVSGVLLLTLRPFEIGDQIVIGDLEGTVERIELRATRLRMYDGRVALVPNAQVFTSRLINNTADPVRRGHVLFYIAYQSDVERALDVVRSAAGSADGVLPEPSPAVRLAELSEDNLILELTFWTDSRRADFRNTSANVRTVAIAAMKQKGIALPEPDVRHLVLRRAPTAAEEPAATAR